MCFSCCIYFKTFCNIPFLYTCYMCYRHVNWYFDFTRIWAWNDYIHTRIHTHMHMHGNRWNQWGATLEFTELTHKLIHNVYEHRDQTSTCGWVETTYYASVELLPLSPSARGCGMCIMHFPFASSKPNRMDFLISHVRNCSVLQLREAASPTQAMAESDNAHVTRRHAHQ